MLAAVASDFFLLASTLKEFLRDPASLFALLVSLVGEDDLDDDATQLFRRSRVKDRAGDMELELLVCFTLSP